MRTRIMRKAFIVALLALTLVTAPAHPEQAASLKSASLETMMVLTDALVRLQVTNSGHPANGALACPGCMVYHTRAAEAVFPMAVAFQSTGDEKYRDSARRLAEWLFRQQQPGGEWLETPWAWTGTTADQLLMLAEAFPILSPDFPVAEKARWKESMRRAADYLVKVMDPAFASINYCPTTAAALMVVHAIIPDSAYVRKARLLARQVLAKMDDEGFIQGEAARAHGVKYGVDLGYEMDMSLWGLGLYAHLSGDTMVDRSVRRSLAKNLPFVYPNGAVDGSWGSRCYKWTTYGSKTADGCQILFGLYGDEDLRYITAALRNLEYLRGMIAGGMIGNGPGHWKLLAEKTCIYPTFARAKNLAMTVRYVVQRSPQTPPIPSDRGGWLRVYPTVNVALARSANFMMTVSAYNYRDPSRTNGGQYNQHPTGGSVCNLWGEGVGFLTTSSQTRYVRGEPIHMPVMADSAICLTPRIEYRDSLGYFTNLYEFEGRMTARSAAESVAVITTSGELRDEDWLPGGVGFSIQNVLFDDAVEKSVTLSFHDRLPTVRIIEPIVSDGVTALEFAGARRVFIRTPKQTFILDLLEGAAELSTDREFPAYKFPFPAIQATPVVILVSPPSAGTVQTVRYRIGVDGKCTKEVPRDNYFTMPSALERARLTHPAASAPVPPPKPVIVAEKGVVYAKRGARELHLDIFRRPSARGSSLPALLLIHGGGWRSGDRSMEIPMAQRFAGSGYVAAVVEYRLSPEARYPAALEDCREALRWLRVNAGRYSIDTNRIAVMGGSSGGHLAALLGTTLDAVRSELRAVVDCDGPVDLTALEESGHDGDPAKPSSAKLWLGSTYSERPDLWRSASPAYQVNKRTPPVLFVNSSQPRYRAGRDLMIARMNEFGIETSVVEIPDSPHTFWILEPWSGKAFDAARAFLDRQMNSGAK
jgi:acetyl esterase/lipase